jgi:hypothetical protein
MRRHSADTQLVTGVGHLDLHVFPLHGVVNRIEYDATVEESGFQAKLSVFKNIRLIYHGEGGTKLTVSTDIQDRGLGWCRQPGTLPSKPRRPSHRRDLQLEAVFGNEAVVFRFTVWQLLVNSRIGPFHCVTQLTLYLIPAATE